MDIEWIYANKSLPGSAVKNILSLVRFKHPLPCTKTDGSCDSSRNGKCSRSVYIAGYILTLNSNLDQKINPKDISLSHAFTKGECTDEEDDKVIKELINKPEALKNIIFKWVALD